ncbi:hypothetical protein OG890_06880 [Streptomyces anulatus]|uniref:hypothetical protein n=1 Tax=Streptomyces anulatus TaxID=1892 RepID=UPI002256A35F|nr:hypothetical protein [Streptomyces anulatus]MCX4483667.1 hypothetical protein [Streptomyces anulatus]
MAGTSAGPASSPSSATAPPPQPSPPSTRPPPHPARVRLRRATAHHHRHPEPVLTAQEFANQIIAIAREFSEAQAKQRSVANDLDTRLIQIGRQRREWKTAEQGIPALIFEAQAEGYEPSRTAVLLGVSPSYVRRILRENHHYSWRVDLFESDAGPRWQP